MSEQDKQAYDFYLKHRNEMSDCVLPIDMHNTVISKPDEQAMVEMVKKPKSRVDHKKEWYVAELAIVRMENHALKCEVERLKIQSVISFIIGKLKGR